VSALLAQAKAQSSLAPSVSGPVSARRLKESIAEARCQALPLHSLLLPGHLLLQGQLPLFEAETTAGKKVWRLGVANPLTIRAVIAIVHHEVK